MHRHTHRSNHIMHYEFGFSYYQRLNHNNYKDTFPMHGWHWINRKCQIHYLLVSTVKDKGINSDLELKVNVPSTYIVSKKTSSVYSQYIIAKVYSFPNLHSHLPFHSSPHILDLSYFFMDVGTSFFPSFPHPFRHHISPWKPLECTNMYKKGDFVYLKRLLFIATFFKHQLQQSIVIQSFTKFLLHNDKYLYSI